MTKKIKKHVKFVYPLKKPKTKETLLSHSGNVPLNIARSDRISFSVLKNEKHQTRKIENISYEININDNWEWVVRYDDHGGTGQLHRHYRISLKDNRQIDSTAHLKKFKNKDNELTWVCKDIKINYLIFRSKFLKNNRLDLY